MSAHDEDPEETIDREAILARRRRFVSTALTGITTSTLATACPCLDVVAPPSEPQEPAAEADDKTEDEAQDDGDPVEEASPADGEIPPPVSGEDEDTPAEGG